MWGGVAHKHINCHFPYYILQATIQIQKEGEKDEIDEEDDDTVNFRNL